MKILFLTQYFYPEVGAPQTRIFQTIKILKEKGHQIIVLAATPNYPKGEIYPGYKNLFWQKEIIDDILVIRTWVYISKKKNFIHRILNYLSFTISSIIYGSWQIEKIDVIIAESPPLFLGISGWLIAKLKRAKYILNIADLWPKTAIELGIIKNKKLIKLSGWLELFIYRRAILITAATQGCVDHIKSLVENKKVELIPNGVDLNLFHPDKKDLEIKTQWQVDNKFVVLFAGLFGLVYNFDLLVRCARLLKNKSDIVFLLIGGGPMEKKIKELIKKYQIRNILVFPPQSLSTISVITASANIVITPLRETSITYLIRPVKMLEAMASGIPVVVNIDKGEAADIIKKAKAGFCLKNSNSAEELAEIVLTLYSAPDICKELSQNGRRYVEEYFDRKKIIAKLEGLLLNLF